MGRNNTTLVRYSSIMLVATQQSSAEYDLQTEIYNIMVSYNANDVIPLCHTWKECILILVLH